VHEREGQETHKALFCSAAALLPLLSDLPFPTLSLLCFFCL
jgi:hypothetical protein